MAIDRKEYPLEGIPLLEVRSKGEMCAVLDPRRYMIDSWGPGDLHTCYWRIYLQEADGSWTEVSSPLQLSESWHGYLQIRVQKAVERVLRQAHPRFRFAVRDDLVPAAR